MSKNGIFFVGSEDGGHYEVYVYGEYIGSSVSYPDASWMYSYYRQKANEERGIK